MLLRAENIRQAFNNTAVAFFCLLILFPTRTIDYLQPPYPPAAADSAAMIARVTMEHLREYLRSLRDINSR